MQVFERRSIYVNTSRTSSTVGKALGMLKVMAEHPDGVRLTVMADQMGLGRSSAHFLAATLVEHGFAEQTESGAYRLGLVAFEVGSAVSDNARFGTLTGPMKELADLSGEAVSLSVRQGTDAVMVQRFESRQILRAEIRLGTRMPLHSCASGKYLLAHMSDAEVDSLYPSEKLPRVTDLSVRSMHLLRQEFPEIRRRSMASNRGEYTDGVDGIATGVHDRFGRLVAVLSIAGPNNRFDAEEWTDPLFQAATVMTRRLSRSTSTEASP